MSKRWEERGGSPRLLRVVTENPLGVGSEPPFFFVKGLFRAFLAVAH